ncbi:outer membrane beta-barrel protein [Lentilitoribacter sp. Alg239-R112]|uniref:outer membrane beta-barrel protein n=1 Tax=Lentilitoribacter sp. Alg239-R112 TaxID=2305987 RepID=UPI0013A6D181|nr:outer membrane beta-barrel protein [Lentilitoribacter sp. Alg239-R112]
MRIGTQNYVAKRQVISGYGIYVCFLGIGILGILTNHALAQSTDASLDLATPSSASTQNTLTETPLRLNSLTPVTQGRQNLPLQNSSNITNSINADDGNAPGIGLGSFTLRPSVQTRVVYENEKTDTTNLNRVYNQTTIAATLQSDWSRHSLAISGTGTLQKNISGTLNEEPNADIDADLELNLNDLLTANIRGGYNFRVEDRTDPNAISNATSQANIHTINGELALSKDVGIIRGSITGRLSKEIHGDAILTNNTKVSGADRDLLSSGLALRIQYAANPVLMPFVEGELGRVNYTQKVDNNGIKRSYSNYALRLGLDVNLSDKLSGDFAVGYVTNKFDDSSLINLNTFAIDSNLNWSPRRGTDATLGFATVIEPSTSVNVSGAALYSLTAGITQQISNNLNANIGANYSLRRFSGSAAPSDQTIYGANAGLDWSINRYVSMNADASYSKAQQAGTSTIDNVTVGLGLTLTR